MKKLLTLGLLTWPATMMVPGALATSLGDYGINDLVNQGANLGKKDLRTSMAGIINVILGFLGVIAVCGILYGGFTIMRSQGQADKNNSGRAAVIAGVIGLAIVLAAFAISSFILGELYNATNS